MTDMIAIRRDDTRRSLRLEPMTETGWAWLRQHAASVGGWWLFGGYDVSPEDGATLITRMRAANLTVKETESHP